MKYSLFLEKNLYYYLHNADNTLPTFPPLLLSFPETQVIGPVINQLHIN
jgi:hypothetical protein